MFYDYTTSYIRDLVVTFVKYINIPEHQRKFIWKEPRQIRLINTIMNGLPMPSLAICEDYTFNGTDASTKPQIIKWLEDGQQRFYTIKNFYDNKLLWNNKYFRDLTQEEKDSFMAYKLCILTYRDATEEEKIQVFDNFQNGVPLTAGDRFHANKNSILVKYAIDRFMTPQKENGFYERMSKIFGPHKYSNDTKGRTHLTNVMAIAGGVAHGVQYITKSFDTLGPILNKEFDETRADTYIQQLLSIFEEVEKHATISKKSRKNLWNVGYITGYILSTIIEYQDSSLDTWRDRWITYMIDIHTLH